jgi:cytoskeleton protein RodZ
MHERVGLRLRDAREARGLTIEDVVRETRIRAPQLRSLENDDYGNFPSPSYAKSFLAIYAKFLHVDVTQELETFDVDHGHKYADPVRPILSNAVSLGATKLRGRPSARRALLPLFLIAFLGLGLLSLFAIKVVLDINRSGGSKQSFETPQTAVPTTVLALENSAVPLDGLLDGQSADASLMAETETAQTTSNPFDDGVEIRRAIPVERDASDREANTAVSRDR